MSLTFQPTHRFSDVFGIFMLQADDVVSRLLQSDDYLVELRVDSGGVTITLDEHNACDDDCRDAETEGDDISPSKGDEKCASNHQHENEVETRWLAEEVGCSE